MSPLFTALTVLYVIWLAALLLVAYTPRWFKHYTLFKAVNSILFVVIAVAASQPSASPENPLWPRLLAFSFAAFGDIAIGVANNRHGSANASRSASGLAGVAFFCVAHIFYLLWFAAFIPLRWYHFILPLLALLAMLRVTSSPSFHFSRRIRPAAIFYYMVVTLMFSVGLQLAFACPTPSLLMSYRPPVCGWALGLGVTLFLLSDLLMLPLYFYTRRKCPHWVRFVNLVTYYTAQLLLALCPIL